MPKFRITAPDGGTYEITAPEGASQDQVLAYAQSQFSAKPPAAAPAPDVHAPTSGVAMGLRDAVDAGAQMLRRAVPDSVGNAVDTFGNWLADKGLPVARSNGVAGVDKIVHDVNAQYDQQRKDKAGGQDPGFDGQRLVGNLIQPANYIGGGGVAAARTIPQLAIAGAKAGAVSGALQPVTDTSNGDFWTQKGEQAGAGAVSGAVLTPVIAKGTEKVANVVKDAIGTVRGAPDPTRVQITTNNIFTSQGLDPKSVPKALQDSVQRQVNEAMAQGQKLEPAAIMRRAQFEAVGLTGDAAPTAGQLSRDPMQWANEKNLSGVRLSTAQGEGNPLAQRFQEQNNRLQGVFDLAGAGQATDRVTAGQTIMGALKQADAPVKGAVDDAYTAARAMTDGRAMPLDHGTFSQTANKALDDGMLGHYVPPEIRNMLNDVTSGKMPLTVETAEQFDSIMSKAQRTFGKGSPQELAIGRIRQALHDTPFTAPAPATGESAAAAAARTVNNPGAPIVDTPFREIRPTALPGQPALPGPGTNANPVSFQIPQPQPGAAVDEGAAAREAFAQARAAARQRFATIESTPALKAALEGEAPDRFVQNYILNANVGDVQAMKKVLANSPEALAQARAQLAEHLKNAAFGTNVSGDKAFAADRYANVLRSIGPEKLKVFFSPEELVRLNLAAKVASDINSKPAGAMYAVNSSGTGAALMNLLSKVAGSPLLRNLPGGRAIANQVGEIQTERAINQALSPQAAKPAAQISPEARRALQLLFTPAGVAGGVLGGAAVGQ